MIKGIAAAVVLGMALAGFASDAFAQAPSDVRIDIRSEVARRIRIHAEALEAAGDRAAGAGAAEAQETLANDLDASAAFAVSRGWSQGQEPFDVQAIVGGRFSLGGGQLRLTGLVWDFPARRPILSREYRGRPDEWRTFVHRFADDVVLQFTGESGVADSRIAFIVPEGRDKELWVMDADGARPRPLTHDGSIALSPSWSPDGSLLLFTSYRGGTGPCIYVTPATGGNEFLVSARAGNNTSASYSPDGREIACTLSLEGNPEIYLLDARGGNPRRLTSNRAIDTSPAWAPTGREIAFTSDRTGSPEVYVMDRDGGNVRRLTDEVSYTDSPAWSPRGDRIAFVARTSEGFDVYACRADGSDVRRVVSGRANENPHWSPDGRHLVFASNRDGAFAVYVTDLDDRPPRRIEVGGRVALSPAWSPRSVATGTP
ncbi:MAG: PD40 domain-containing protein [Candidatus Eisenbacteria bacterium]|nr:PD40 domain-containing protein [Candidatus Eisenbacteria bacterium]